MVSKKNRLSVRDASGTQSATFWFWPTPVWVIAFLIGLVAVLAALQKRRVWRELARGFRETGVQPRAFRRAQPAMRDESLATPPSSPAVASQPGANDLRRIRGIGPKTAQLLNEHGIYTFEQLAAANPADLSAWLAERGWRMIDPSDWPEQARHYCS